MNDCKCRYAKRGMHGVRCERVERLARGGEIEGRGLGALIPSGPCIFPTATAAHAGLIEAAARAEEEQARAEHMAGIESGIQAARWSLPVDFAIDAYAERFAVDGEPHADLEISGDHRPRHGRLHARCAPVDWREQQRLTGRARHFGSLDEDGM